MHCRYIVLWPRLSRTHDMRMTAMFSIRLNSAGGHALTHHADRVARLGVGNLADPLSRC